MATFNEEIMGQPQVLRDMVEVYREELPPKLGRIALLDDLLLTGMGASFHAAQVAAFHFQSLGFRAMAIEAVDLLQYGQPFLQSCRQLVYISQSGSSAEVLPIVKELGGKKIFMALTNDMQSPLAKNAQFVFPLMVADEQLVASQTYLNTLAILWLLARLGSEDGTDEDFDKLLRVANKVEHLLEGAAKTVDLWMQYLYQARLLVFTGFGPHAATARQAAQTVAEWVKVPVMYCGAGALRHGFVEMVEPGVSVVVFTSPDVAPELVGRLVQDLEAFGAQLLVVQEGDTYRPSEPRPQDIHFGAFLAPMLDVIPVQLFTDAAANQRLEQPGFRYLQKVVKSL